MIFSRQNSYFFLLLSCLLLNFEQKGCKKKQVSGPNEAATQVKSVDFLQKKLTQNEVKNITHINTKANAALESDGSTTQVTVNIIWVKDSILWFNVKKFGIEAARGLITPDSLFLINRLQKNYMAKSWDWVQQTYNLPEGFKLLTPVMLGNAWFLPEISLQSNIKEQNHQLFGSNYRFAEDFRISEGSYLLKFMTYMEPKDSKSVSFSFDNHQKTSKYGEFAYLRRIDTFSPETGASQLTIELSDVEFNTPKAWKFEIPNHYSKVD
jgi:Domain of unknown function (DUF4292)